MENIEALTEKRENLYNKMKNLTDIYRDKISDVVAYTMGKEWTCTSLRDEYLQLCFIAGQWDNGNPRYQGFDIYFKFNGSDCNFHTYDATEAYSRFEVNTACFGSFNIEGESMPKTYYIGVGKFLSDNDLHVKLKSVLSEYFPKYLEIRKETWKIDDKIADIKRAERDAEMQKKEKELFEQQKEILSQLKDGETKYIVIAKGETCGCNYTYRKQPVRWATTEVFDEQYHAMCTARMCNRSNYIGGRKYAVIEISKLKIA